MTDEVRQLIDISHVSKRGSSLRITIPKKAAEIMGLSEGEIVGFFLKGRKIVIERIR